MRFGLLLLVAGCGAAPMPDDAALDVDDGGERVDAPACGWSSVRDLGTVSDPRLTEVSGMVASRRDPGVLFVHNDSGEAVARYFALTTDGVVRAEVVVDGAPSFDIEDAALEFVDGREWIYLADTGDNAARDGGTPRDHIDVVRSEIPPLPSASSTLHVAVFERFAFTYPDAPHDCEALVFDQRTGDLYLLSKVNEGPHAVYRAAAPHVDGSTGCSSTSRISCPAVASPTRSLRLTATRSGASWCGRTGGSGSLARAMAIRRRAGR